MKISTSVAPSRHKIIAYIGFVLVVFLLALAIGMAFWHYLVLLVVALALFWSDYIKPGPIHLVSGDELWQACVSTSNGEQLWQFYVNRLCDFGYCVVLEGYVVEPTKQHIRWVFVKDMMAFDEYCTLRALARFGGG